MLTLFLDNICHFLSLVCRTLVFNAQDSLGHDLSTGGTTICFVTLQLGYYLLLCSCLQHRIEYAKVFYQKLQDGTNASLHPLHCRYCPTVVPLPADRLLARLSRMPESSLYPLLYPHTYSVNASAAPGPTNGVGGDANGDSGPNKHQLFSVKESLSLTGLEIAWHGFGETDHYRQVSSHPL